MRVVPAAVSLMFPVNSGSNDISIAHGYIDDECYPPQHMIGRQVVKIMLNSTLETHKFALGASQQQLVFNWMVPPHAQCQCRESLSQSCSTFHIDIRCKLIERQSSLWVSIDGVKVMVTD